MYNAWKKSCELSEKCYFEMIDAGAIAQQARDVLSTSVKTELIITTTEKEWQHIINLRYHGITGAPHPQMVEVMTIVYSPLTENAEKRIG
jgi:thymidylate synthase (FAD)